ncbi:MAG: hypothetical protein M1816_006757 [Peltula sp. TS41687]|nr:MAG: hypothetical protein M1816_006757 [Peltula sp. TS41687]
MKADRSISSFPASRSPWRISSNHHQQSTQPPSHPAHPAHLPPPRSSHDVDYFDRAASPRRISSEPHSRNPSFSRRHHDLPATVKSALHDQHLQQLHRYGDSAARPSVNLPSPLESPRSPVEQQPQACYSSSLGSSEATSRYGGAGGGVSVDNCANCSLSLPQRLSEKLPDGAPGSPTKDGRGMHGSPVLRTREAFIAGGKISDFSDLDENHSSSFDGKGHGRRGLMDMTPSTSLKDHYASLSSSLHSEKDHSCSSSIHGPDISRASSFATYPSTPPSTPPAHKHTLTYLTTRQPPSIDAHSLLRGSCIRTLSCEQPPRTNSGPLFFGDDVTGYTISFIFRVPDACARGKIRRYAFIAWAGREERRAARAYKEILHVFASMAGRIVDAVEKREFGTIDGNGMREVTSPTTSTPLPPLLPGRSVDPDWFTIRREARAKGLVELVGKEDLFVEIHAAFVHLLAQLGRCLGGWPMGTPAIVDSGIRGEVGEEITTTTTSSGTGSERDASSSTAIEANYDCVLKRNERSDDVDVPEQQQVNGTSRGKREIDVHQHARESSPLETVSRRGIVV